MKIGEVARQAGVKASALRYYERCGLLPAPHRISGQRRYAEDVICRVMLIRFASDMGFSLAEIKVFLSGLSDKAPVGPRWRMLARRKIAQVDAMMRRSRQLKALLEHLLECRCGSLQMCVGRLRLSPKLAFISASEEQQPKTSKSWRV